MDLGIKIFNKYMFKKAFFVHNLIVVNFYNVENAPRSHAILKSF